MRPRTFLFAFLFLLPTLLFGQGPGIWTQTSQPWTVSGTNISRPSGLVNMGSDTLVVSPASTRVGIGTNNPQVPLHIGGAYSRIRLAGADNYPSIAIAPATGDEISMTSTFAGFSFANVTKSYYILNAAIPAGNIGTVIDINATGGVTFKEALGKFSPQVNAHLPSTIYCTAGTELNLFKESCFYSPDSSVKYIGYSPMLGLSNLDECVRFSFAPTNGWSTNTLRCLWSKGMDTVLSSNLTFIVSPTTAGTGTNRTCLFIGDSTMEGTMTAELLTLFSTNAMALTLIGTDSNQVTNKWEGQSGWTYSEFATNASSPFILAGAFDFNFYLTNNAFTIGPRDWVIFQLGINGFGTQTTLSDATNFATQELSALHYMATNILAVVPGCRIAVAIPYLGAHGEDGTAANYGALLSHLQAYASQSVFITKLLQSYASYGITAIVPAGISVDPIYGYSSGTVQRSYRIVSTLSRCGNEFHPIAAGYYQAADCFFSFLKCNEP